jgi:hypothetical protein
MKRMLMGAFSALALLMLAVAAPAGAHGHGGHHAHGWHHGHHADATVVKPGESIQAAVDAAAPGATIFVKRGTYAENVAITTDGITLKGHGAKLVPPATPTTNACSPTDPATDGICATGKVDFPADGPPNVTDPISDVTISGFIVEGFKGTGILYLGAENPVVKHDLLKDNGEYGVARFVSTGGKVVGNWASGSGEAGIYVGDSPEANVLVAHNATVDNVLFGIFLRDAANGHVVGNRSSGNCVGAIVLNTGGNVAGDWFFTGNKFKENNRFCAGDDEEGTPPLSGIGVLIANAHGNKLFGNVIKGNVASGEVPFSGGVVVVNAGTPGAELPTGNVVKGNLILGNQPDLFWDGSGDGNVFDRNRCETSVPDGLCKPFDDHGHGHGHRRHGHGDDDGHHHGGQDDDHGDRHGGDDHGDWTRR